MRIARVLAVAAALTAAAPAPAGAHDTTERGRSTSRRDRHRVRSRPPLACLLPNVSFVVEGGGGRRLVAVVLSWSSPPASGPLDLAEAETEEGAARWSRAVRRLDDAVSARRRADVETVERAVAALHARALDTLDALAAPDATAPP
jgi:hypothetical protein